MTAAVGERRKTWKTLSWGERYFADADFGDARRSERMAALFDQMCRRPGGSLPSKLPENKDLIAFYRLMDAEEVTHAAIINAAAAAERRGVQALLDAGQTVLLIHDATELDYTRRTKIKDRLGQIGQGTHRGYICHNSLAIDADGGAVAGLLSQILHHRADVPKGETDSQRRERDSRESRLWLKGAEACGPFSPAPGRLVHVADSLSDTFEFLSYLIDRGGLFLLRSREDRRLAEPFEGHGHLYDAIRAAEASGSYTVDVPESDGQPARTAHVSVSFIKISIAPPARRLGHYENKPLSMWAVRAWESGPPKGIEPLEWILLTNVPVECVADAKERTQWYKLRFRIEDFHKGMKTGCAIEGMQFDKLSRLEPAIALLSLLAVFLMRLRDQARHPDAAERDAREVVGEEYIEALKDHYPQRLGEKVTVLQFYLHVARLGGHQNRKRDGFPGWITLWRGWMRLEDMAAARRSQGRWKRLRSDAE